MGFYDTTFPFRSVPFSSHRFLFCLVFFYFSFFFCFLWCFVVWPTQPFPLSTPPRQKEVSSYLQRALFICRCLLFSNKNNDNNVKNMHILYMRLADCTPGSFLFIIGTNFVNSWKLETDTEHFLRPKSMIASRHWKLDYSCR